MEKTYNVLVVDDERLSRKLIIDELNNMENLRFDIVEAFDVDSAILQILRFRPQLVLMDVQLKDALCFDIFENLSFRDFQIIFITAYEQYALKAIKLSAVDYILKPISTDDLRKAVQQAIEQIEKNNYYNSIKVKQLIQQYHQQEDSIIIHASKEVFKVYYHEILYLEADSNYTIIHFTNRNNVMVARTLKYYVDTLGETFIRVHQSYCVNTIHIDKIVINQLKSVVKLMNGVEIPVSRRMKNLLKEYIQK